METVARSDALSGARIRVNSMPFQAEAAARLTVEGLDFAHANTSTTYRQGQG